MSLGVALLVLVGAFIVVGLLIRAIADFERRYPNEIEIPKGKERLGL